MDLVAQATGVGTPLAAFWSGGEERARHALLEWHGGLSIVRATGEGESQLPPGLRVFLRS